MFKSHLIKSNQRDIRKKQVDPCRYRLETDKSATVLAVKMCTNFHEHSMYIRCLRRSEKNRTGTICCCIKQ
jgi:hypothetical protein